MKEYTIEDLTPPAVQDIIANDYGGGMVQAIVFGVEVITPEGERRNLFIWDKESSITIQLGLSQLLQKGLDIRALDAFMIFDDDEEDDL